MSKLQKSAWFNLGLVTPIILISMLCFVFLSRRNAKGVDYIFITFLAFCISVPLVYTFLKKKGIERNLDEREKIIYNRSFMISAVTTMIFLYFVCTIPFFVVGGGNVVKVLYLPLIFFSALFTAQFVQSIAIIFQCMLEEEDG